MRPTVAWYRLPALYQSQRNHYLAQNDSYTYKNYIEIFCKVFPSEQRFSAKSTLAKNLKVTFKYGYGNLDLCHSDRSKPANSQIYASKNSKSQHAVFGRCNLFKILLFSSNFMDRRVGLFLVNRPTVSGVIRPVLVLCLTWWSSANSSHSLCRCHI